jgi:DNA invertase Pin-like site-specific DNA recombinase
MTISRLMRVRAGTKMVRAQREPVSTGTTRAGRDELRTVLDFLRKGDVLMVTRIDRLARSIGDLQDIVRAVKARDASLKATEQPIDTSTAAANAFSTCSECSQSSKPTYAGSVSLKE